MHHTSTKIIGMPGNRDLRDDVLGFLLCLRGINHLFVPVHTNAA